MITKEILSEATRLVGTDRQKDYGDKVENHNNIAKLWSAYLDVKIEAHDVAIMMALLKIARTKLGFIFGSSLGNCSKTDIAGATS